MCFNSRKPPLAVFLDIQIEAHTAASPCLPTLIAFAAQDTNTCVCLSVGLMFSRLLKRPLLVFVFIITVRNQLLIYIIIGRLKGVNNK